MKRIVLAILLLALAGCQNAPPGPPRAAQPAPPREARGLTGADTQPARPPLDRAAPAATRTATFALG